MLYDVCHVALVHVMFNYCLTVLCYVMTYAMLQVMLRYKLYYDMILLCDETMLVISMLYDA